MAASLVVCGEWTADEIQLLKSRNPSIRAEAARELMNGASTRPEFEKFIPDLIQALDDSDERVRARVAGALGNIGPDARSAVRSLTEHAREQSEDTRGYVIGALASIGGDGEVLGPIFTAGLTDSSSSVQQDSRLGFQKLGAAAKGVTPDLIRLLNDGNLEHCHNAAYALAMIGPDAKAAIPSLIRALSKPEAWARVEVTAALVSIGERQHAIPELLRLLRDQDQATRTRAAYVAGTLGAEGEPVLLTLAQLLSDDDQDVRRFAGEAVEKISQALQNSHKIESTEVLRKAANVAGENGPATGSLREAVSSLDAERARQPMRRVRALPWFAFVALAYGLLFLLWIILWGSAPLSLVRINAVLVRAPKLRMPSWLGGIEVSAADLSGVKLFTYRERVLDRWVARHIDRLRSEFEEDVPRQDANLSDFVVSVGVAVLPRLEPENLRVAFARPRTCIVILSENARARTSVAHHIGEWVASSDAALRPCKHAMMPLSISRELEFRAMNEGDRLLTVVVDKLGLVFEDDPPPQEFVMQLLKRKRILVVLNGFSELSETTRGGLQFATVSVVARALLITARADTELQTSRAVVITVSDSEHALATSAT